MERPAWAPQGIDISVPSVSRMYDFYLGGSHNFEVDREAARKAMEFMPGLPKIMQANRAFMRRAVRYAVDVGRQPVPGHRLRHPDLRQCPRGRPGRRPRGPRRLRRPRPGRRRAQPGGARGQRAGRGHRRRDLRKPQDILGSPEVTGLLDLDRPVALLLVAVLHFIEDADDPYAAVAELRDATGARQPPDPHPRLVRGDPAPPGAGRPDGRCLPGHPQSADHALARRDRAVLRGIRHGRARPRADARTGGPTPAPGGGGSLRLLGVRAAWARAQSSSGRAGPDDPEGRLRRFATIWSRAIFPVDGHLPDPPRVRGAPACRWPGG